MVLGCASANTSTREHRRREGRSPGPPYLLLHLVNSIPDQKLKIAFSRPLLGWLVIDWLIVHSLKIYILLCFLINTTKNNKTYAKTIKIIIVMQRTYIHSYMYHPLLYSFFLLLCFYFILYPCFNTNNALQPHYIHLAGSLHTLHGQPLPCQCAVSP